MLEDQTQTEIHWDSDPFESGSVLVHLCIVHLNLKEIHPCTLGGLVSVATNS